MHAGSLPGGLDYLFCTPKIKNQNKKRPCKAAFGFPQENGLTSTAKTKTLESTECGDKIKRLCFLEVPLETLP
jgi:hypothetical protein